MRKILIILALALAPAMSEAKCPAWTQSAENGSRYAKRIEKATQWLSIAQDMLAAEGLPSKWLYLMLAESGGDRMARSEKGAQGPWQLMPATARRYGCKDPQDPESSTIAAASYLKKLLADLGNERDAIIGYNMGGTNYRKSKKATAQAAALANEVMCLFEHDPLHLTEKSTL